MIVQQSYIEKNVVTGEEVVKTIDIEIENGELISVVDDVELDLPSEEIEE